MINQLLWQLPEPMRSMISSLAGGKVLVRVQDPKGREGMYPTRFFWTEAFSTWCEKPYGDLILVGNRLNFAGKDDAIVAIHRTAARDETDMDLLFDEAITRIGHAGGWTFWQLKEG